MFDINALINNAITTAVAEAIKPLVERIEALEQRTLTLSSQDVAMGGRIAALENIAAEYTPAPAVTIDEAKMVEALNSQEWFWEKLTRKASEVAQATVEHTMDLHQECYDHDSYDEIASKVDDMPDADELAKTCDIRDAVRDAVQDLSFEIRVY